MADYIPQPDAEFDDWQAIFYNYIDANQAALGLTPTQVSDLDNFKLEWEPAYSAHLVAQDAARAATETKNGTRTDYMSEIRKIAGQLQSNPAVTDAQRESMGLTVRKTSRTPTPVPTTQPAGYVDTDTRLQHTIHFHDQGAENKARPAGVASCEIWVKVGTEPPASTSELTFLGVDTRTPYLTEYTIEQGGLTAYYMLRWVNTRGDKGPWSDTIVGTIRG